MRRYLKHYGSSGHVWQERFKAFPIAANEHLLVVLRYIERNAVRAGLARRAELWPWCSAPFWQEGQVLPSYLTLPPVKRPRNWLDWVNEPATEGELLRNCSILFSQKPGSLSLNLFLAPREAILLDPESAAA